MRSDIGRRIGNVLVTGASKGIGRATALRLDLLGWRVFAGVRNETAAEDLKRQASGKLVPVRLDVADEGTISAAKEEISGRVGEGGLEGLVNNAGIAVAAPLEFIPMDAFREQMEVNLTGQLAVTQEFLPLLRRAEGRIVNLSSIGGRLSTPMIGPYHASKFGLEALSDALRVELRPWGIEVILIEPGAIATPIWEVSSAAADRLLDRMPSRVHELYGRQIAAAKANAARTGSGGAPPETVARTIEKALTARRPKTRYLVGTDARIAAAVATRLPTRLRDRLLSRQVDGHKAPTPGR
ncbi:MAG: SDR family NAD(P)-dependent oxidoreductase [Rubrobacteraceae bacterium]